MCTFLLPIFCSLPYGLSSSFQISAFKRYNLSLSGLIGLQITAVTPPYIAPPQGCKTSGVPKVTRTPFTPMFDVYSQCATHMAPAMFFLSCQPPLCPTFMLPAEIATPACALHGYYNILSPDDPKTHPSRCQHYGPWSPQGIDTRPVSKDPDSKGYHSQPSDSDSS